MNHTVFLLEDEPNTREVYNHWLKQTEWTCKGFSEAKPCLDTLVNFEPSVICLDLGLPDIEGMEALRHIRKLRPKVPVIVMTANDEARVGVEAIKLGATDYLVKPLDRDEFVSSIDLAIQRHQLELEVRGLRQRMVREKRINGLVGQSAAINHMTTQVGLVLNNSVPVLLEGETGTGKELVARTIHLNGNRADKPFVPVNCGAIPKELQESHFFGHEKGSFSGAASSRVGFFEEAQGGTVFLDEVGELSLDAQVKLLRVLQEKTVRRVGGSREIPVDVRVISATHRDLKQMVKEGAFREDLYFRLVIFPIEIPPLRDRVGDVPLLLGHFLRQFSQEMGLATPELTEEALACLVTYDWPGNVRQLQNVVQFAVLSSRGEPVETCHLPPEIPVQDRAGWQGGAQDSVSLLDPLNGKVKTFQDLEQEIYMKVREMAQGNVTRAAQMLGVGRATFYRKLQEMDLPETD
jgi:DNA-binding NtrC family response regulator